MSASTSVVAVRLFRGLEKLDRQFVRRSQKMLLVGTLIFVAVSSLVTVGVVRLRGRRDVEIFDAWLVSTLCVGGVGLSLSGLCRMQSMTLSQTVDQVLDQGLGAAARSENGAAVVVLLPIMIASTCGGWYVWESLALSRAQRRAKAADRARAVQMLVTLRESPAGVGTKLVFKPRERADEIRRLVGFLTLHELIGFDEERVWLSKRGNALIARAV